MGSVALCRCLCSGWSERLTGAWRGMVRVWFACARRFAGVRACSRLSLSVWAALCAGPGSVHSAAARGSRIGADRCRPYSAGAAQVWPPLAWLPRPQRRSCGSRCGSERPPCSTPLFRSCGDVAGSFLPGTPTPQPSTRSHPTPGAPAGVDQCHVAHSPCPLAPIFGPQCAWPDADHRRVPSSRRLGCRAGSCCAPHWSPGSHGYGGWASGAVSRFPRPLPSCGWGFGVCGNAADPLVGTPNPWRHAGLATRPFAVGGEAAPRWNGALPAAIPGGPLPARCPPRS